MKIYIRYFFLVTGLIFFGDDVFGQAPVITYTPSTNVYTTGTAITSLTPTNTGGAVTSGALTVFANIPAVGGTYQPFGISFDPTTGDVITDDYFNGKIYVYSPQGVLLTTYTKGTNNRDIVVDSSGNIYVAAGGSGYVIKITPAGVITTITGPSMSAPAGLCIDASGTIYMGDWSSGNVYQILPGATAATIYASGFTNAYGVAVNSTTGDVYVSESSPQSKLIKIAAGTLTQTTVATGFNDPRNIITDASGNIYLSDEGASKVVMITPAGVKSNYISTGLNQDRSTVFNFFGDMYIANSGGSDVMEYSANGYSIDKALPPGLTFNTTTGTISGTPTGVWPTTVYTIAAHNASGTGYTTVTITVNPTSPTINGAGVCGTGAVTLTASGGNPAGGTYSWYTASTGGSAIATGSTYSPTVTSTTTYYVDYSQGGMTCASRTAVTVTVASLPVIATAPTTGAYFSYSFTGGITTDISGSNNGTLQGAPAPAIDRYNASGNAYGFNGASQYISTTTSYASPGPQAFSISAWFKTTAAGGYLAGFGSSQTGNSASVDRVVYIGSNGQLYFGVAPGGVKSTITTASAYNDGNWHHVVATFSTTNGSNMYVDGALAASNPALKTVLATAGYWRVAYDVLTGWTNAPATAYFNGSLDDIAVANSELTSAQVNVLYGAGGSTFCAGNTLSLTANTVAGATYSWSGPGGFTSAQQNPTVSAALAGTYVLTVTGSSGCQSILNVTAPSNIITYTWTGAAGTTDPTNAGNWNNLPLFTSTTNLVIPTGLSYYPALTTSTSIYGLTLASGASINLNGQTLSVGCNIYNSSGGQILYGSNTASQITWNGSVASQNYYGSNASLTAQVGSMVVNNSVAGTVTISGGPVDVFNLLTLTKGNLVVASSPAALTLKSSSTLSATVTAIPAAYSISGNVSVERYISGGSVAYRGYRFLSSPIYTVKSGSNYYYDLSYLPSFAPITGTLGTSGGVTKAGNPSIYFFRDDQAFSNATFNTYNYRGVNKINNSPLYSIGVDFDGAFNLHAGTGFLFFYRGNLSNIANKYIASTSAESNVFVSTGTLNQQAVTVTNWYTQLPTLQYSTVAGNSAAKGFNLVGNPYASSIDWNMYSTTNSAAGIYAPHVSGTIYIYNEVSRVYATYSGGIGVNGGSNIIPSGQGFFVRADTTGGSLTFNEAAKTNTQLTGPTQATGTTLLLSTGPVAGDVPQYLRMELAQDPINKEEAVIVFDNLAKNIYHKNEDSPHFPGSGSVSFCSVSDDNMALAIDRRPLPKQSQTIRLSVNATADGIYKLNLTEIKAIPRLFDIWLMDAWRKDSLDIRHNPTYAFNLVHSDTNTYGSNRFSLVIRQNPALGMHLLNFTAARASGGVQVSWKTENEENYTNFTVERSTDNGVTFDAIGGFISSAQGNYGLLDTKPVIIAGYTDQYRLKVEDVNGTITYSRVVSLGYSNFTANLADNMVMVYPNPATGIINIDISAPQSPRTNPSNVLLSGPATITPPVSAMAQSYQIRIVNSMGAVVKTATSGQPTWQHDVSSLQPGTYFIQVTNNADNKVVGKAEFVKL